VGNPPIDLVTGRGIVASSGRRPMSSPSFQKRQREKAKREKAAAKRERRAERAEAAVEEDEAPTPPAPPEDVVLTKLAALHEAFDNDRIDFETFEEQKQELMLQLQVD
jgi:hypothetical protein